MADNSKAQTLFAHLEELRKRLIICAIGVFAATAAGFVFAERLQEILTRPAGDLELIFVSPPEALMANFRLAFIAGLVLSLPLLLYQFLAFVLPGLYKHEQKVILPAVLAMVAFFALGVSFATQFLFGFGVVFQLPMLFWVLGRLGVVDAPFLQAHRKHALLLIVIMSAILTPPDVISQAMMAMPLMLLYELGILLVVLSRRGRKSPAMDGAGT